jgi:PAS domain S-box-containing protein
MRLRDLLEMSVVQRLVDANYAATGIPTGIIDASDGTVLVCCGWQDICSRFHRLHPRSAQRCRETTEHVNRRMTEGAAYEHACRNGLRDIGVPINVAGEHLATVFLGQFFYEGEQPDRARFAAQARELGFDEGEYLAALDRVPVLPRLAVERALAYDLALARAIADLAESALQHAETERALRESEARFRQLADSMPQIVWTARPDGFVDYFNRKFYELTGAAEGPQGDESWLPVIHPDDRQRVLDAWYGAARAGRPHQVEFRYWFTATGAYRWYLERSLPVRDGDGRIVRWYGTCTDIDDQKRLEEALRDADRRKDEFLSMLSHELRNPLAPIRSSIYVLDRADPMGDQARRARAVIGRQVEHLTRLVDDLLDVTRIARGKAELRRARVDLAELARRASEDHRASMVERRLEIDVQLPREPIWLDGDPTRLTQIIGNLLQNAAKFTPAGGRVTLALTTAGTEAEISVRDTGVGIEPGLAAQVFEPFVQADRTLARSDGGLGLGLALVKGLAELHGGAARVRSDGPGRGAEFIVRLPVCSSPAEQGAAGPAARPLDRGRAVLVVDDNRDAAESLAALVALFGHRVEVAHDGPTALAMARANPPEVVFCDIGLPGMSGYDVARALRRERALAATRIVAVSGYAQPEDQDRASAAGFDRHVAKPADPAEIERLLG